MPIRTLAVAVLALTAAAAEAGNVYKITAKKGDEEVVYNVKFGGGRRFEQFTAFDPVSKKFVYLTWNRGETAPKPAATIWDHRTGETIKLYTFPDVETPLPAIPAVDAIKVCPMTGDKGFKVEKTIVYD
ncbi:hypothetical protein R5W23_003793 [Gemmata sp. JC673]|uniref:Uncharacterized protein n=1 Tax=Gemmata algarum TaxID=2975278 RepID=A0ABU5F5E3_9BACT|nr:hypothetical protein [Gemmata algarum]MDY3562328.1 hypothetical protein [Gemmata algarum]